MKPYSYAVAALLAMQAAHTSAQSAAPDTSQNNVTLDNVIISANKVAESHKTVAQQIIVLDKEQIANSQAQTTADLLSNTGMIFVQKSQMGGGSPVLRGFEANRILMVVDGVRMNNIIYRAGHLQNIITMDNAALDRAEVLFGPASNVYGSDALGGVIHFYTKKPAFAEDNKLRKNVNAFTRYGSVNNEMTGHADFNIGGKRFASLTSFTYSSFGDLKGGTMQNPLYDTAYGVRPAYADRINGIDTIVMNSDKYKQVQSAYSQYDVLQKFAFKQNEHITHGLNFQYSNSTDIPRYDRLTDRAAGILRYSEWYYGPQQRMLAAYDLNIRDSGAFFQAAHAGVNYQNIEESRHNRNYKNNNISHRVENVNVMGVNLDLQRAVNSHTIRFGLDGQYNTLKSTAQKENIATGVTAPTDTRYPGGDNTMMNTAIYGSHTWLINDKFTLTDGLRLGYISLHSVFNDTSFFPLPFTDANQDNLVYSGSLGLIHIPSNKLKLSLMVSTGYRAPNVDDLAKVFESAPGSVVVPNNNLKPEKTLNTELGVTKIFGSKTIWENALYYTQFFDAIVTGKYRYQGQDSVMYDGSKSRVLANQNERTAYIYGFSSQLRTQLPAHLSLSLGASYTYGRINTDSVDQPLDHIPPLLLHLQLDYSKNKLSSSLFINYNGAKQLKDYYLNGEDNEQYATPDGMPAWFTANFRIAYKIHKLITLQAGIDNILDTQYRAFASGINAPGRNIFGTIRFHY
jgi:hemoglobin/transferrin/lactoferrin receptor protein